MKKEIWKDILEYKTKNKVYLFKKGKYQISNYGRIRSFVKLNGRGLVGTPRILKPQKYKGGYFIKNLYDNDKNVVGCLIHRLVAFAFIPNSDNLSEVNHIDENKENNYVENLEWVTHKENMDYGTQKQRMIIKQRNDKNKSKSVLQFDMHGNFIQEWESLHEIERQKGFDRGCIWQCCVGKIRYAYGFIWKYK